MAAKLEEERERDRCQNEEDAKEGHTNLTPTQVGTVAEPMRITCPLQGERERASRSNGAAV